MSQGGYTCENDASSSCLGHHNSHCCSFTELSPCVVPCSTTSFSFRKCIFAIVAAVLLVDSLTVTAAAATSSLTPTQPTATSDMTLTETQTQSPDVESSSRTISMTRSVSESPHTFTDMLTLSWSATRTPSFTRDRSYTPRTLTRTESNVWSETTTNSAEVTVTNSRNVTRSSSVTFTQPFTSTESASETDESTHTVGGHTGTLTETTTLSESIPITLTPKVTTTITQSVSRDRSRTRTRITKSQTWRLITVEDSQSKSLSVGTKSSTKQKTRSPVSSSPSVTVVMSLTKTKTNRTKLYRYLSFSVSSNVSDTWTSSASAIRVTSSITLTESSTRVSPSQQGSATITVSETLTSSLQNNQRGGGDAARRHTKSFTISGTITVWENSETATFPSSMTKSMSSKKTVTRSATVTMLSGSVGHTSTMSGEEEITDSETVSRSGPSMSRTAESVSTWKTVSVTKSITQGSREVSSTRTESVSISAARSASRRTFTDTLTETHKPMSHTKRKTRTFSISSSLETVTMAASETRTLTETVTNSTTLTLSQATADVSVTPSLSAVPTRLSTSLSHSQAGQSKTKSVSMSSTIRTSVPSLTSSRSVVRGHRRSETVNVTASVVLRPRGSRTTSFSVSSAETSTVTVSLGSHTRSRVVVVGLNNALQAAVASVLFPRLSDSSAPCISLALYIELPLFIVFCFQLILLLAARTANWKVNADTHHNVPMWRSLSTLTSYVGFFIPCHVRCAYAHTLRAMCQLLFVQVMLEILVATIAPVTTNMAAFCVALTLVVSQCFKPLTHAPYHYFRFPKDEELSARMHLAQMKRIIRLRKQENKAAAAREKARRRAEGLDDASSSSFDEWEDPQFAYEVENVVAFDYLEDDHHHHGRPPRAAGSPSSYGDIDVAFPDEGDVFGTKSVMDLLDESHGDQLVGPGYVDVTFPGDDAPRVVDMFSERRPMSGVVMEGGGSTRTGLQSSGSGKSSMLRDVPAIRKISVTPSKNKKAKTTSSTGGGASGDEMSLSRMSLGSVVSFESPTKTALAIADGKLPKYAVKKPKKKRIGPGRDGVVVIPDFDDDLDVVDTPRSSSSSDDNVKKEDGVAKHRRHHHASSQQRAKKNKSAAPGKELALMLPSTDSEEEDDDDDDNEDVQSVGSSNTRRSDSSRFRVELQPIVTYHFLTTVSLVLLCGLLLFAVDRFRFICLNGFEGNFGALWGITVLLDVCLGDAVLAVLVWQYRRLMATGEEGTRVVSCLHPYEGEMRNRLYEHLSERFTGKR